MLAEINFLEYYERIICVYSQRKVITVQTDSHHRFRKHKNLVSTLEIERPESARVSDITYVGTRMNPSYLALITAAYSKENSRL
jgi:hypothetical protein